MITICMFEEEREAEWEIKDHSMKIYNQSHLMSTGTTRVNGLLRLNVIHCMFSAKGKKQTFYFTLLHKSISNLCLSLVWKVGFCINCKCEIKIYTVLYTPPSIWRPLYMKAIFHLQFTFSPCKAHHCSVSNNQQKDLSLRILQCNHVSIKLDLKSWYLIFDLKANEIIGLAKWKIFPKG